MKINLNAIRDLIQDDVGNAACGPNPSREPHQRLPRDFAAACRSVAETA